MRIRWWRLVAIATALVFAACGGGGGGGGAPEGPVFEPTTATATIDNPWLPLVPGTTAVFEGTTSGGFERIEETVTTRTKTILGAPCVVVESRAYVDGELVEETLDWYSQDAEGNVWYLGEDTKEYEGGVVVSTEGSWEAGVDGAEPGILMLAAPEVGDAYRQEYYEGEAEDMAEVVGLDVPVTLGDGTPYTCLVTREWTPLEPDQDERKYYAEGVGLVREAQADGSEPIDRLP